jgi:hypothetical protein
LCVSLWQLKALRILQPLVEKGSLAAPIPPRPANQLLIDLSSRRMVLM